MTSPATLRIAITSDLHWEIGRTAAHNKRRSFIAALADTIRATEPDVLVIAGDAGNGPRSVGEALGHLAVGRLASLFVPGNHDVYLSDRERDDGVDSSFAALDALAAACDASGFQYLPGNPTVVGGVGFAGTCGWYDYSTRSPEVPANYNDYRAKRWAGSQNQDAFFVHWRRNGRTVADEEMAEQFEAELVADMSRLGLDAAGSGPPTVAISHMLPYRELWE